MSMRDSAALALLSLSLLAPIGCAAPTDEGDGNSAQNEDDLTALPTGHFAIVRAPLSGSYISSLTLSAGKKVEIEYVRVTSSSTSLFGNPFFPIPTSKKEAFSLRGTYFTYKGDGNKTNIAFDVGEPFGSLSYALTVNGGTLGLQGIGQPGFELKSGAAPTTPTDKRVLHCVDGSFEATIKLDEAQRRRGTITIKRLAGADRMDPPNGSASFAYTGDTGVRDYQAFEGTDKQGNGYEFALSRSEIERTSGKISNVGLSYSPEFAGYGIHHSMQCSIGTR